MRPPLRIRLPLPRQNHFHSLPPLHSRPRLQSTASSKPFTTTRPTHLSDLHHPEQQQTNPHRAYYQNHGRALLKCLTLAFFTYQIVYWAWLTLEAEEIKERKNREIRRLEGEVRGLLEGREGGEGK